MTMGSNHTHNLSLDDFDSDGAVRETFARLPLETRSGFLIRAGRIGAVAAGAFALRPAIASAASSDSGDVAILNFALALEYLQASFYTEAERIGALHGALAQQAQVVGGHERDHVRAFKAQLKSAAIKEPKFNFHGVTENPKAFRSTAVAFEDLAAAAYKEQAPKIKSRAFLAAALGIHTVEARHAAWIRRLAGELPAPTAFDQPKSRDATRAIVDSTHFIVRTESKRSPHFTG